MNILYVVATPIGNLKDISLRALEVLRGVDLIVCEDTRVTKKLLNHYNISKPLISYFQHSRLSKIEYIIEQLKQGKNLALVTDAGTPGISDPGGLLVDKLVNLQTYKLTNLKTEIIPIPGPCALTTALSISGFPADKFLFLGFPPHKKGRQKFFKQVATSKYTIVFYESPHRILKTLEELKKILVAGRWSHVSNIVVCRELTKKFETIYRGNIEDIIKQLQSNKNHLKGEFVVVISK